MIQKNLDAKDHIGQFDTSTIPHSHDESRHSAPYEEVLKPSLHHIVNLYDFEDIAARTLPPKAWAYISGASNDNITRDANMSMLKRIWFRPSILRNVSTVTTKTSLFGCDLKFPIYIAPTGAVCNAGPEGELAMAHAAASSGTIQCIATLASYPHEEILDATPRHAFFQLYVNQDRAKSEKLVQKITASGKVKALVVTVDLPVVSKREADERAMRAKEPVPDTARPTRSGMASQYGSIIDPALNWKDIDWLKGLTGLPLVIKGIQRWEDAKMAMEKGCQGVILSNHGGRAADTASPAIILLLELNLNCPEVFASMEILVEGGFRRGSDILKAICLGASAVGIGRPFMYAVNYGKEGVEHSIARE